MNKKMLIICGSVLLGIIILVSLFIFIRKENLTRNIKIGADKIATQSIAIVYHPYNEGIDQLAAIIKSRVGGDVYKLEPVKAYPTSSDLLIQRLNDEQEHPEKVSLKDNKFDLKKYHVIFVGVPVINNKPSPIMMRFTLNIEHLLTKDNIIIPFVYYSGNDNPRSTYEFLYYANFKATSKNGFISSTIDRATNEMDVDIWLNDISFKKSELQKPTKEKAKLYKEAMIKARQKAKEDKQIRDRVKSAPAKFNPKTK